MIETTASKSFAATKGDFKERRSFHNPLVWLNLVCLDAPVVAISWLWLFARSFGIPIAPGGAAALFLTAWFVYLADRFGDNLSLDRTTSTSLRQRFCRQHLTAWLIVLLLVGVADLLVVLTRLDPRTRVLGAAVAVFAFAYLCVNQLAPVIWRWLPLKEICIGFLFTAGVLTPLAPGLASAGTLPWFLFASLCSLNCLSIAVWERGLDLAQDRVSAATTFPTVARLLLPMTVAVCLTSCVIGSTELALSAALLAALQIGNKIQPDVRTALADLVLLTPIATLMSHLRG
ncbi:MAG: hypothetical protein M3R10_03230 [Verrucomicrobiota bacterium]|nr:hypothetical protein [Verrucomicrobiota bacterium]